MSCRGSLRRLPPRLKLGTEPYPYLPKRMCECAIPKFLRASRRSGVLIIVVVCFLGTRLHSCASLFLKIRNPKSQSTNLAGSLDGAPIITQSRRHKPCSKIEVSYSAHSQLAFDASLLFTDCQRDCDCDLRFARCCAAAVRSHNIIPKSARLVNLEGWLIDATGYAPGLPSPKRPISVPAQNLWGIPSVLIQVLFSLPICLLQGGVAKSYEGMKTPFC